MIDPLSEWKSKYKDIPLAMAAPLGASNLADFLDARVSGSGKLALAPPVFDAAGSFAFMKSVFAAGISGLPPTPVQATGATAIASAWMSAIMASIYTAGAGAYVGAPAPPTMWAAPPVAVPDPAALSIAYASLLAGLISAPIGEESELPRLFREAFAAIGFILTGVNMIPPPAGPLPLIANATVN